MQITLTQLLEKKPKKLSSQEKKFQHAWRKISKLKAENSSLTSQLDDLVRLVDETVAPFEQALSLEYHALVDKKLRFLTMKSLAQWQRFELAEWIEQSFDTLQQFSQADAQRFQQQINSYNDIVAPDDELFADNLSDTAEPFESAQATEITPDVVFQQMLDAFIAEQVQQRQSFERQQQASGQVDFLADEALAQFICQQADELTTFKQMLDDMQDQIKDADPFSFFEDEDEFCFNHDDTETEDPYTADTARLKKLFSDTSLKEIFRKLAKVLHPDREQDPERVRHKQVLMSDALKAREEGDILTLFAMYSEHVSQDGLYFEDNELEALNELLTHQITQLQDEKHQIIRQSPAHHKAFECFYDTNRKKLDKKITHYIQEIEADKAYIRELTASLSSLRVLKPILEDRREAAFDSFPYGF